jgi:hypothetical protein
MNWILLSRHLFFLAVILDAVAFGLWYGVNYYGPRIAKKQLARMSGIGNCKRWRINRGKVCACGKHITVRSVNGVPLGEN